MQEGSLRIDKATVSFGGLKAVDDVSFAFPAGAITGLIGPNGSGKSTLVNLVSGQLPPSAGAVWLDDRRISRLRADQIARRGLARTYQIPRFPPQLSVGEVLSVPLTHVGRHERRPPEWRDPPGLAAYCGLSQPLSASCAKLPVTDMRRLEIARALACNPRVLLLDEAMAGLSLEDSAQVIALVRRIHETGVTIVVIEHVMRVIATLCDHVVVLDYGRILADGGPREVLTDPRVREVYLGKRFAL